MNVIKSNWVCSVLIFATGITLCCLYDRENILAIIVYILGVLFTATGCVNIIVSSLRHNKGVSNSFSTAVGWIAGLGGIGLGAAMLIVPREFTSVLVYIFAALLILGGLWHFLLLSRYFKSAGLPGWLYIPPLVIVVAGVVMFCSQTVRDNIKVSILMSGIGALIFSVVTLLEYLFSRHHASIMMKGELATEKLREQNADAKEAAAQVPVSDTQKGESESVSQSESDSPEA